MQHLELNEPSLDDVFAEATGYRLEGEGSANLPEAQGDEPAAAGSGGRGRRGKRGGAMRPPSPATDASPAARFGRHARRGADRGDVEAQHPSPSSASRRWCFRRSIFPLFFAALGSSSFSRATGLPGFPEVDSFLARCRWPPA